MSSNIDPVSQVFSVSEVTSVLVTDIVASGANQVRAIRVYGSDGDSVPPILEIRVYADDAQKLKIATPAITF